VPKNLNIEKKKLLDQVLFIVTFLEAGMIFLLFNFSVPLFFIYDIHLISCKLFVKFEESILMRYYVSAVML